jgi:hypothetical protein
MKERMEHTIPLRINPFVHNTRHRPANVYADMNPMADANPATASLQNYFTIFVFLAALTTFGIQYETTTNQSLVSYIASFTII